MENQPDQLPASTQSDYGEMSLSDIVEGLQRGKKLIAGCAILGGLIAALFLSQQRGYFAEAHFLPPSAADIEPLNIRAEAIEPLNIRSAVIRSAVIPVVGPGVSFRPAGNRGELLTNFSVQEVYGQFLLTLQSHSLHRRVLEEHGILDAVDAETSAEDRAALDESFREWEANFSLKNDSLDPDVLGFVRISQQGKDPEEIALFLNRVAELAADKVLEGFKRVALTRLENRRSEIATILTNERARAASVRADTILQMEEAQAIDAERLRNTIDIRKRQIEAHNSDQIVRLKEALAIAEAAGMEDPLPGLGSTTSLISLGGATGDENGLAASKAVGRGKRTRVNINASPLFFRGSKMLKAELEAIQDRVLSEPFVEDLRLLEEQLEQVLSNPDLEALRNRASDDPFIVGLRELEVEDRALAQVKLPDDGLAAATFDQNALPPRSPMIGWGYLLPGILLGLAFGVILALLQRILNLQRKGRHGS